MTRGGVCANEYEHVTEDIQKHDVWIKKITKRGGLGYDVWMIYTHLSVPSGNHESCITRKVFTIDDNITYNGSMT